MPFGTIKAADQIMLETASFFSCSQRQAYAELNLSSGQLGIDDLAHVHPGIYRKQKDSRLSDESTMNKHFSLNSNSISCVTAGKLSLSILSSL